MLHLAPETVALDRAQAGATAPVAELLPVLRTSGVRAVAPNGVLGDPTGASAAEGARLLATMADAVLRRIARGAEESFA
jgi:creatinine amidohydrolase